ncbi:MAG: hypothetical protein JO257_35680 [Deltaproteobacteria bacterium]|nr:hypothetical protein [Deltaproteobacteria bacterium]
MGRTRGSALWTRASTQQSWGTAGSQGSATWIGDRGITAPTGTRWHVEILLDVLEARAPSEHDEATATRFHIDIYSEEWGFYFCHGGRCSWIRVTDQPFVHGKDDFNLLGLTPALTDIGQLVRHLELKHKVRFRREHANIRTNIPSAEPAIRAWVGTL